MPYPSFDKIIDTFVSFKQFALLLFVMFLVSCNNDPVIYDITEQQTEKKDSSDPLVSINKEIVRVENQFIQNYIERHQLDMTKRDNGIYFDVYQSNADGQAVSSGDLVEIQYQRKLLTGHNIEKEDSTITKRFVVEESDDIQGMHFSVLELRQGESGIFIIPSHLAYGITGKRNEIPRSASLVLDIKQIKIIDNE